MNDYPTEEELLIIEKWEFNTPDDLHLLINYLEERWMFGKHGYFESKGKNIIHLRLSTAGWSGNESMISALEKNPFWFCFWQESHRGGHYYFTIDLKTFFPKTRRKL